ncbi:glycosyltransferase family 2 protein [Burkholderia sp. 22PA0106]|uniref:glycosyltransferase family 2 protein n=1 Tax=Burkholderia sp. 22PA0106 TaxID=3237371 RepID=UPI0039C019EE
MHEHVASESVPLASSPIPSSDADRLSVSIVVYHPEPAVIARTLSSLAVACAAWRAQRGGAVDVCLVVNGGTIDLTESIAELEAAGVACTVMSGHGNVGYGRGHNLAIEPARSRYHLVLNPDVDLEADSLVRGIAFLDAHPDAGLLAPRTSDGKGRLQYLCRRYPAVLDLFVRGFLPASLRRPFAGRLARYEMRDCINATDVTWQPPIVSGCFMLFRTEVLKRLGGFDPRYFLYFEDYDLSVRASRVARIVYVPAVRIAHHGGGASRKGFAHIRMFAASAFRFYRRFGWKWL